MIICPLCKTSSISSFISSMLNTHISSNFIRASVRCTYCSDDFYAETDLNWKTSKDTAKVANPSYKLLKNILYTTENKEHIYLKINDILTLQGFELSKHSNFSPFKTFNGDIIRINNKDIIKI